MGYVIYTTLLIHIVIHRGPGYVVQITNDTPIQDLTFGLISAIIPLYKKIKKQVTSLANKPQVEDEPSK